MPALFGVVTLFSSLLRRRRLHRRRLGDGGDRLLLRLRLRRPLRLRLRLCMLSLR